MPSSPSGHRHGRGLLLLAMVASLSTFVMSMDSRFTLVDCQTSAAPSPAPSLPPASSSSTTTTNSTFWSNVVALLEALPSAAAPTGFASLSRGNGTNRAFVRGICRGDSAGADCARYLRSAGVGIRSRCNQNSRRAAIWYDDGSTVTYPAPMFCFVSFADTNTSTPYERKYCNEMYNTGVARDKVGFFFNGSDEIAFENTYYTLMTRLAARVVNGSGDTPPSSLPEAPKFATGEAVYDPGIPNGTMYGLMQCMRDLTAAECQKCLQDSVPRLPSCCFGNLGGVVRGYNCYIRMEIYTYYDLKLDPPPPPAQAPSNFIGQSAGKKGLGSTLAAALPSGGTVLIALVILGVFLYTRNANWKRTQDNSSKEEDSGYVEPEQLNLAVLRDATDNFSKENKLGEGGFGEVFKVFSFAQGTLQDGAEIAVKRLSRNSSQGFQELKNELVLAAKLEHRNLVRLLGVSLQKEKLLVYEYMPNRSLDTFLLDPVRRHQLDWSKRFTIICGIARGLLYLHEESRLKVIHRDLKPSNVLLDADMNPKISDFGIARAFGGDQSRDITRRPVGTLGYMSPEYAYWGHVSTKSDMFSFGVIVLEMVTGRRNNSAYDSAVDSVSVLSHVWDNWRAGLMTDVVDPLLTEWGYPESEVLNCIEIGLLCVQENPVDRPDASAVVLMLSSPTSMSDDRPAPSRPAFVFSCGFTTESDRPRSGAWSSDGVLLIGNNKQPSTTTVSENEVSISELQPR
ncbi:cysteine-rich receptor-like protein kinase 15 isoform X3 [Setaria viridis]|uniref:cysteine-rich receptor-like protein kinase 15 isoform X3 n=1 Tax=Setaria viridis TaxID=4556 RepID=UPI003B3B19B6